MKRGDLFKVCEWEGNKKYHNALGILLEDDPQRRAGSTEYFEVFICSRKNIFPEHWISVVSRDEV